MWEGAPMLSQLLLLAESLLPGRLIHPPPSWPGEEETQPSSVPKIHTHNGPGRACLSLYAKPYFPHVLLLRLLVMFIIDKCGRVVLGVGGYETSVHACMHWGGTIRRSYILLNNNVVNRIHNS